MIGGLYYIMIMMVDGQCVCFENCVIWQSKNCLQLPPPGAKKEKCLLNSKYLEPLGFLIKGQGPSYSFCGFSLT